MCEKQPHETSVHEMCDSCGDLSRHCVLLTLSGEISLWAQYQKWLCFSYHTVGDLFQEHSD